MARFYRPRETFGLGHNQTNMPNTEAIKEAGRYLRSRDRFTAELRAHLLERGFSEEDVEGVVSYLIERKLLDDQATTNRIIERRSGKRSVGEARLRAELARLGAPDETITKSLMAIQEADRAMEALAARYGNEVDRGRAGRFLAGRGFDEDVIESVLDRFCTGPSERD